MKESPNETAESAANTLEKELNEIKDPSTTGANIDVKLSDNEPVRPINEPPIIINRGNIFIRAIDYLFPYATFKSFTFGFSLICLIYYLAELATWAKINDTWECSLFALGAKNTPSIVHDQHYFRWFVPLVMHFHIFHLLTNMYSLYSFGFFIEKYIGISKAMLLFFYSGINSFIASSFYNPSSISVGPSGAIFGFLAFMCMFYIVFGNKMDEKLRHMTAFLVITVLINIAFGVWIPTITVDIYTHMAGMVQGFLMSLYLVKINNDRR